MIKEEYEKIYRLENRHWWYVTLHRLIESQVREVSKRGSLRILDAGCGTGRLIEVLQPYGSVDGIDYSDEAIRFCRERRLAQVTQADLNTWNGPGDTYDVVTCIDLLYHESIRRDGDVVRALYRVLKPGGILIINLPAFNCLKRDHDKIHLTARRYEKEGLRKLLADAGFEIRMLAYRLPQFFIAAAVKKMTEKIFPSRADSSDLGTLPKPINDLFIMMGTADNSWIRRSSGAPFGISLFAVAQKKAA